jgi:hypothetical protein
MKLHHIGIAVASIDRYYNDFLKPLFGYDSISETMFVEQQHSKIAFVENGQMVKLELIEAIDEKSPTYNLLKENKGGLYHIAYVSEKFEEDIALLRSKRCILISNKAGVAFFMSPTFELYELLDKKAGWN